MMSEKEVSIKETTTTEATSKAINAKYARIAFATFLLAGIAMYILCYSVPQPTNLAAAPFQTSTHASNFDKRDDSSTSSSTSNSDSSETSDSKSTPIYDKSWMQFLFALAGLIVLNMIAICIHHLYLIVTRSQNKYRAFEDEKSPF
ncbi:hypothetical protein KGF57_002255 [Candida theae]|uniref:Transmembrane protein n=1 Tax=Candida theae TaxID=1198502 RepID=A0AAD5FYT9_9ASCO|nr:uncharacterized protein KGF57_002255 [Candida theae]KAI5958821.1 hypothetical protein KGF57_002255 [Candida theae]